MVKTMAIYVIMDLILISLIFAIFVPRTDVTKNCSPSLYSAGVALCIYNVFFVLRNLAICTMSYFSKSPVFYSNFARLGFVCIDCCAYTAIVIWATTLIADDESLACKGSDDGIAEFWYLVVCLVAWGYLQLLLEWLVCLVAFFVTCLFGCFYFTV